MRLTFRLLSSVAQRRPFYVTTPIFYVNAAPHLGHLYTAVVADAIQRFEKLTDPSCNVIFSTGTDEHGTKIQQAAAKVNLPLHEYCTNVSNEYRALFKEYNVGYTDFIRTTEERHKKAVTHFWGKLVENDYVYKAKYSGWYSVNDEAFVPETHVKDEVKDGETVKVSMESGHRVEWTEETNYMFRLSAFKTHLQQWLKNDGVITPHKFQKQLQDMLESEVYFPDISVSRPSSRVHWAIRVPGDEEQSIYVWLDALINYLSVVGYPAGEDVKARGRPWPADVQVVGKDILKFHAIYWPAFLMAIKFHPPRRIVCHSHWTVEGGKMSKSVGNVVAPRGVGVAPAGLRYMLLREATMHADANYSEGKLLNICNSELADTLGNLASRCVSAALNPRGEYPALREAPLRTLREAPETERLLEHCTRLPDYSEGKLLNICNSELADTLGNLASRCVGAALNLRGEYPALREAPLRTLREAPETERLLEHCMRLPETCHKYYTNYQFYKVADAVIHVLHIANLFFETMKPWDLKKKPECQPELDTILHITMETLRICGIILQPIVPDLSETLLDKLQVDKRCRSWQHCETPSWADGNTISEMKHIQEGKFVLFHRIYRDKKEEKNVAKPAKEKKEKKKASV